MRVKTLDLRRARLSQPQRRPQIPIGALPLRNFHRRQQTAGIIDPREPLGAYAGVMGMVSAQQSMPDVDAGRCDIKSFVAERWKAVLALKEQTRCEF